MRQDDDDQRLQNAVREQPGIHVPVKVDAGGGEHHEARRGQRDDQYRATDVRGVLQFPGGGIACFRGGDGRRGVMATAEIFHLGACLTSQ
jgi:hypothetical protein